MADQCGEMLCWIGRRDTQAPMGTTALVTVEARMPAVSSCNDLGTMDQGPRIHIGGHGSMS